MIYDHYMIRPGQLRIQWTDCKLFVIICALPSQSNDSWSSWPVWQVLEDGMMISKNEDWIIDYSFEVVT